MTARKKSLSLHPSIRIYLWDPPYPKRGDRTSLHGEEPDLVVKGHFFRHRFSIVTKNSRTIAEAAANWAGARNLVMGKDE